MRRRRTLASLVYAALAALTIGATAASADPLQGNPTVLTFTVACPNMDPFDATVVGAPGFAEGQRLIVVRRATATQGSLDLVRCTATNPEGVTQTVFLQFVERG